MILHSLGVQANTFDVLGTLKEVGCGRIRVLRGGKEGIAELKLHAWKPWWPSK